jgi:hypothetical protein
MNSRGLAGCSLPGPSAVCPCAYQTKAAAAAFEEDNTSRSPPLFALRALVPSGLACVLARPPYGEAQTAIWAARWAKLPDGARRFSSPLSAGPLLFVSASWSIGRRARLGRFVEGPEPLGEGPAIYHGLKWCGRFLLISSTLASRHWSKEA